MTEFRHLKSENGWVMVPVMILMVVAIGVGMALLTVVDQQTKQTRTQRSLDSAQTLAEGAVTATANVLATDQSTTAWPATGACRSVSGDLTTAPAADGSLASKIVTEVQSRFSSTSPDYISNAAYKTAWRVDICPVLTATEARWDDTFLNRTVATAAGAAPTSVWVRGQASVRSRAGVAHAENSRAVVSKVRQSSTVFTPPANYAVGSGVFSTDIGTTLSSTLTSNTSLVGGLASKVLGTDPLIAASTTKIGVRCGLLTTLNNLSTTCLSGSLAGVAGVTNAAGVGTLNTLLGIDRTVSLPTWTMAPTDAIESWRAEAQASGVYSPASSPVPGYGDDRTKSVTGDTGTHDCFTGFPTASQVVFIEKVGNGDQYCNVPPGTRAKILIVERGAVRIKGAFTGVVYALNKQECTQADGTCSSNDRAHAITREVVRIDGNSGKVTGSVWADGAAGAVGIYPSLTPTSVSTTSLINVGDVTTGVCGIPGVTTLVNTLTSTLNGLLNLVSGLLTNEQVRYPNGASSPTGCDLLKTQLGSLTTSELLDLYAGGGSQTIVTTEHRTRANILSPWGPWTTNTTTTVAFPSVLTSALPSVVSQVSGLVGATLNNYTAITYDAPTVSNATSSIAQGAGPVVGTYRNVAPLT